MNITNLISSIKYNIDRIANWWILFNANHNKLRWLPFLISLSLVLIVILQYITPQVADPWTSTFIYSFIAMIGFFYSTKWFWKDYAGYIFIISFLVLTVGTILLWFVLAAIIIYIIYQLLVERRIKKIMHFATTSPYELARISREKIGPKVEVTIRAEEEGGEG